MIKYFLKLFEDYHQAMKELGYTHICVYGAYYVLVFQTFDEVEKK